MKPLVAICTNRPPEEVAAALTATASQAEAVALVVSGATAATLEAHRALAPGVVLAEPRGGLSRARNRALAWAEDAGAQVLAFVDDDALVAPGWFEALTHRWAEAPAAVACIGGPIRPRYAQDPPEWFSDGIAHTLTLLDRGGEVRDIDPAFEAVYGANISFRTDALRRVGGFDPGLGHAGGRVFFGEEDAAERALAALGYTIRYVPDAAVWHLIGAGRLRRRALLRRRLAFGVSLGRRGGRSPALAAGKLALQAPGALLAAVAGDGALAMERAVRAAENAGVLLAPALR